MGNSLEMFEKVINGEFSDWALLVDEGLIWKDFKSKDGQLVLISIDSMGVTIHCSEETYSPLSEKDWRSKINSSVEVFLYEYLPGEKRLSLNSSLFELFEEQVLKDIYRSFFVWNEYILSK
ncbi:hypothetical protein [Priestia aryabhattai]